MNENVLLLTISDAKEFIMCIPHGAGGSKDSGYIETKPKKHIKKVPQEIFEKGDPNFIDERQLDDKKQKEKKSFFDSLFGE